ncbi:hypothetical protein NLM31_36790 [Bradyrhizobium sp. CCGUVB4N]|uniref:hypothetical protein n=1 Tax=Bradyrhizobium sp. CCGUVB4N TaxID=2949631 RepID=UPI0020B23472|nr:hypothetical protein [Bradyrhizobium sp. CCGUVB4N]MCP3385960.1 hypothetical protein [Bradyrhizobium sp. CCGUVB4N]
MTTDEPPFACHDYDYLLEQEPDAAPERRRRAQLFLQHPHNCPDDCPDPLDYLIHPPGTFSPTARWLEFRDETLLPMMNERPDDRNLPLFLRQVERVLAYRAAISPEERFWKVDP